MFKKLRILVLFIVMTLVFSVFVQGVYAKETEDEHLSLEMQVEQNAETNSIDVRIAVQNTGSGQVENVKLTGSIPEGMRILNNHSNVLEVEKSVPGTREELEYSLALSPGENNANVNMGNDSTNANNVNTGDYNSIVLWVILGGSAFILIVSIKKKRLSSTLSLILSISITLSLCKGFIPVSAEENTKRSVELSEEIVINGKNYVICANVEYNELEAIPVSNEIVTRGEWIQSLIDVMGYSEYTIEYDENEFPYTDIQNYEYFNSILIAYANGFIPETGEAEFKPNEAATREFAATTSVIALGFVPIKNVKCDDVDAITYKQEVETAIAMDILRLDNNKFYPNRELSKLEADTAINGIKEILNSENINDSYESDIKYKEGVVELSKNSTYSIDGNTIFLDKQEISEDLTNGAILVLPDQTAYKVSSITNNNGKYIIETVIPEMGDTLESVDVQGYGNIDMSGFIPAEGVTVVNTNSSSMRGNISDATGTLGGPGQIEFEIKKSLGIGEIFGTFKVNLDKILYKADIDLGWSGFDINNVYLKVPKEIEIDGGFKIEDDGYPDEDLVKDGILELGKIPVAGVPGINVYIEVGLKYDLEGKLHMVYELDGTSGIQVLNNRLRMIHDLNSELNIPELEATAKLGLSVAGLLEICNRWDLIDFNASIGAGVTGIVSIPSSDLTCLDATLFLYGEISALQEGVVGDWLDIGYKLEFWNKDNSPLKINCHYENLFMVDECTAENKGIIKGMVAKADDRSTAIENATVTVYDKGNYNEIASAKTDAHGNYEIKVKEGEYVVIISAEGYISFECDVNVVADEEKYIQTFLLIDEENIGIHGVAEGTIKNAVTGRPVSEVKLSFIKGWNKQEGDIILTTNTDFNGEYQVQLPVGNYTVCMEKNGYVSNRFNIVVLPISVMQQNATLVPTGDEMPEGDLRIVLTWGKTPVDLDSHLLGPVVNGDGNFHISFYNRSYFYDSIKYADLDVDDTTSYGPETTTVYKKMEKGKYSFYVHDYTNRYNDNSTALSKSGAIVEIYIGGQLYTAYPVPTDKKGVYWHVFDYDPVENKIIPVNEFKEKISY